MLSTTIVLLLAMQTAAAPSPQEDEILVVGQRLTPQAARQYVNEISRPVNDQLPTFRQPICPEVIGMKPEQASVVVERIRKVVAHVKVPLAKAGCAPNFRVIVVEDSQKFVSELSRQQPAFFTGMELHEVDRLLKDERPALAWSSVQTQNEDGHVYAPNASGQSAFSSSRASRASDGGSGSKETRMEGADLSAPNGGSGALRTKSASIIKSTTQQAITNSYVVVETPAVNGKSLMQIADYATMRALAAAQPPKESAGVDTILTLFDAVKDAPASIRAPDVAYLKALYSGSPTMNKMQQLNRLSKAVLKTSPGEEKEKR